MPIALFAGENDIIFHSAQTAKRLGKILPNSNINVLQGMGHTLCNLTKEIASFLNE